MYGAILGDLAGFPYEYKHVDLTDRSLPLFPPLEGSAAAGEKAKAGEMFSDKTVLTAALEEGLLSFEKRLPEILAGGRKEAKSAGSDDGEEAGKTGASREGEEDGIEREQGKTDSARAAAGSFEGAFSQEVSGALRRFGQAYPLAGYPMDMSIWLFREGAPAASGEDAGPASRVSPVAWMFQDDLYMMRHMAVRQAGCTHKSREALKAADAAACMVFLALHGSTKEYIAAYLQREFGYEVSDEKAMREEILRAGGTQGTAALCVRAALTGFLFGRDFEDGLRRAVSMGGHCADIASIAAGAAEAFFGIPEEVLEEGRRRLPADLLAAADAFSARMDQKKKALDQNPAAKARWESALTRATDRHPAAVRGNEALEEAIEGFRQKKDRQSFVTVLELIRMRMHQKGRVFVPLASARRADPGDPAAGTGDSDTKNADPGNPGAGNFKPGNSKTGDSDPENGKPDIRNATIYRMQAIRTKDGKLWQPVYTSRDQLNRVGAATGKKGELVLSYAMEALLKRFLPVQPESGQAEDRRGNGPQDPIPAEIEGLVFNPYGKVFFLPRQTVAALFVIDREAGRIRAETGEADHKEADQ